MNSVITDAQCVANEKFNDDQGQGLRQIMKSSISFRSMGRFSLLHSTDAYGILYYPELCSWVTEQRQRNSGWSQKETLRINDRKYKTMSVSQIFIFTRIHGQMILSGIIQVTPGIPLDLLF